MIEKIVYNAIVYRKSYGTSYLTAVIYTYIYILYICMRFTCNAPLHNLSHTTIVYLQAALTSAHLVRLSLATE